MKTQIIHKAYRTVITHEGMTTVVPDRQGSHRVTHVKASGIPEAPSDGQAWVRRQGVWVSLDSEVNLKTEGRGVRFIQDYAPAGGIEGDLWYNTLTYQVKVFTGGSWQITSPDGGHF